MNRSKECVVAVYKRFAEVEGAIQAIKRCGFPAKLVSLVSANAESKADIHEELCASYHELPAQCPRTCKGSPQCKWSGDCVPKILKYGDEMEKGAAIGAGAGGLFGLLAGASALAVAKGDTAFVLGPIVVTSGLVGAYLGAMFGWGVHSDHLCWYEQKVKAGKALLLVHGNPIEVATARSILQETHPAELHLHAETSADDYEIHPYE